MSAKKRADSHKKLGKGTLFLRPPIRVPSEAAMDAAQSASLGRYQILKEMGSGAMGIVYLARDPLIDRQIALKTLRLEREAPLDGEKTQLQRFLDEARSAGILSHPNIVTVHDISGDGNGDRSGSVATHSTYSGAGTRARSR